MANKKIDLGEYVIKIKYNKETGDLTVSVFDELGEILESIEINNDEDDNLSKGPVDELGINLN